MKHNDAELIERTLEGDQHAFAALVEKYQEQIHALAWQKIGDFHIAQEITQDAFITAYQKLSTLTHHNRFAGWLYVITSNKCNMWHRKKKPKLQSLEETDPMELEEVYYSEYTSRQREEAANQNQRAIVRKLLNKLRESERTVVTMHYLAGLTCEEIGKFLGVSPNTVKSRLHRARERLKKEEAVIQENLSSFQLPTHMTENIMKEISRLKPVAPSGNKPLVPLAVSAAAAILVVLLIGFGAQNLIRFQKPFSLTAQSERTVEIVDARLVLESPAKPAINNQVGRSDVLSNNDGTGQRSDTSLFAAAESDDAEISKSEPNWIQAKGLEGGAATYLFATTRGDMYAGTLSTLYRLAEDGSTWKLVNTRNASSFSVQNRVISWGPMAEQGDTIYLATETEILASTDRGETWDSLGPHPGGIPIDLVIIEQDLYLGFPEGIYRSKDGGKSWLGWTHLISKQTGNKIRTIAAIKNTFFAGTDKGLYRLYDGGIWEKIHIGQGNVQEKEVDIHDLAVAEDRLYVVVVPVKSRSTYNVSTASGIKKSVRNLGWNLYHSNDTGETWDLIAHKEKIMDKKNKFYFPLQVFGPRGHQFPFTGMGPNLKVKITAVKGRIVVIDTEYQSYSIDRNGNWVLDDTSNRRVQNISPTPVMLNPNTIYTSNTYGISRSTDGGKSWQQFNSGLTGASILTLAAVNDSLYAITSEGLFTSSDEGESWTDIFLVGGDFTMSLKIFHESVYVRTDRMLAQSTFVNNVPIPIMKTGDMNINRLSTKNGKQTFIRKTPTIEQSTPSPIGTVPGNFAVSGTTYYAEFDKKLFRWKLGATEWYNTGLIDEGEPPPFDEFTDILDNTGFKLAVSDKTVYVGKRDGKLMRSLDEGETWNDVTANLPFSVDYFKAMAFAGENVYVATNKGVARSSNGTDWRTITDSEGTPLVIIRFAVDGTTLYGQAGQKMYQIKEDLDKWEQVTSEIPYLISSLDVNGNTLYVGTFGSGVLHFSLDE